MIAMVVWLFHLATLLVVIYRSRNWGKGWSYQQVTVFGLIPHNWNTIMKL